MFKSIVKENKKYVKETIIKRKKWYVCGEWCKGPYKSKCLALIELHRLENHEVFSNQLWWIEQSYKKPY